MTDDAPGTTPAGEITTPARLITRHLADEAPAPVVSADPLVRQQWDESIWHSTSSPHGIWLGV